MKESVGERLARLRGAKGLSQRDVASPGVSYAYISRVENGQRQPSVKALRRLAEKLGVSIEYLETGSEETTTDRLLEALLLRARSVSIAVEKGAHDVFWSRHDGTSMSMRGSSLTDALKLAHECEDEMEAIGVARAEIDRREEALVRG